MKNVVDFKEDLYGLLDLKNTATIEEINTSFKKMSRKYHPDKLLNKSEEEKKKGSEIYAKITMAYHILSDENQRSDYDLYLSKNFEQEQDLDSLSDFDYDLESENYVAVNNHFNQSNFQKNEFYKTNNNCQPNQHFNFSFEQNNNEYNVQEINRNNEEFIINSLKKENKFAFYFLNNDYYHLFFNDAKNKKPVPTRLEIKLDLEEIAKGTIRKIKYNIIETCPTCKADPYVRCYHCESNRVITTPKTLFVKIPPSKIMNQKYVIPNGGNMLPYFKKNGDLHLFFKPESNWYFDKKTKIMSYDMEVDFEDIKEGGVLEIPYFNKKHLKIKLPPNLKHNDKLVIKNKGWYLENGEREDLKIILKKKKNQLINPYLIIGGALILGIIGYLFKNMF